MLLRRVVGSALIASACVVSAAGCTIDKSKISALSSGVSTTSTTPTTTSAPIDPAAVAAFCSAYTDDTNWVNANIDVVKGSVVPVGDPVTDDQRQNVQAVISHREQSGPALVSAAPDVIRNDMQIYSDYGFQWQRDQLASDVGLAQPAETDEQKAAGVHIVDFVKKNCGPLTTTAAPSVTPETTAGVA